MICPADLADNVDPVAGHAPVFLVGPMGAGKSSVGPLLAKMLSFSYLDMDQLIEQRSGMDVVTIFSEQGETEFRSMEKEALSELANRSNTVIATGGGIVMDAENREALSAAITIWLHASAATLWQRLIGDGADKRPLIKQGGWSAYQKLHTVRAPLYQQIAGLQVDVTDRSMDDAAQCIYDWLKEKA